MFAAKLRPELKCLLLIIVLISGCAVIVAIVFSLMNDASATPLELEKQEVPSAQQPRPPTAVPSEQHMHHIVEEKLRAESSKFMKQPTDPVKCRKSSRLLHESPLMLKKYGPIEDGGWCELVSEPATHLSGIDPKDAEYRSAALDTVLLKNKEKKKHQEDDEVDVLPIPPSSTYLDYRSSSDGKGWRYNQCPVKHTIKCNTEKLRRRAETTEGNQNSNKKKLIKSKALVVYVVTSASGSLQRHGESENLVYFLEHGLIPGNVETALFDQVDYVFAKIQLANESTQAQFVDCGEFSQEISEKMKEMKEKQSSNRRGRRRRTRTKPLPNMRFLLLPKVNCDLCGHAKILDHLGVYDWDREAVRLREIANLNNGSDQIQDIDEIFRDAKYDNTQPSEVVDGDSRRNSYSQIIFLNSGVRGPFFLNDDQFMETDGDSEQQQQEKNEHDDSESTRKPQQPPMTTWVDFVSMGGRRMIPNPRLGFFHHPIARGHDVRDVDDENEEECPIHVASSFTISFERMMHIQSFFLALPAELVRTRIFPLFQNSCGVGKDAKKYCINNAEVQLGNAVLNYSSNTALHAFNKQFHVREMQGKETGLKQVKYFIPPANPSFFWNDPCKSIFVKNGGLLSRTLDGGVIFRETGLLDWNTAFAIDSLVKSAELIEKGSSVSRVNLDELDVRNIDKMFAKNKCEWGF